VSVVCCQVEVSGSDWSLVQRSPTECGVSECEREASTMKSPWQTRGCRVMEGEGDSHSHAAYVTWSESLAGKDRNRKYRNDGYTLGILSLVHICEVLTSTRPGADKATSSEKLTEKSVF